MQTVSVAEILRWIPGRLANESALSDVGSEIAVSRLSPLGESTPDSLAFFFSREYEAEVPRARAGILITAEPFVVPLEHSGLPLWKSTAIIVCADPYSAMAVLSEKFAKGFSTIAHVPDATAATDPHPTIHPSAVVDPLARIAPGAQIGAFCVVDEGAEIGARTILYPGCTIGPGVKIGDNSVLFPRVTVYEWTEIGSHVRIHAGAVIGSDGFGYAPQTENGRVTGHQKIYHLGKVVIGDDVEIGANCTIDRATLGETRIGRGSKLDNDVHVAHNSVLGEGVIMCGGSGTAGGAKLGNFVYIGGMSGITNRVKIGDGAKVAGMCGVAHDIEPGGTACGNPQREYQDHFRLNAMLNRMLKEKRKSRG